MRRPFRLYCYSLAEKHQIPDVDEMLSKLDNNQIHEWMAYDLTKTEKFQEKMRKEAELQQSREMTGEQKAKLFKNFFKGK